MSADEPPTSTRGRLWRLQALDRVGAALGELLEIMAALRAEGGCPWDRAQTPASLCPYILEEAYEVCEAIERGAPGPICEELGDLLFQVVFQAQIFSERGRFDFADIARSIAGKLRRRHPHVFGSERGTLQTKEEVPGQWEALKRAEREALGHDPSALTGVPRALPALGRARKIQERAARVGFDWPDLSGVASKLTEEMGELEAAHRAGEAGAVALELGDVLFTVVNLSRFLGVDPEAALRRATGRFEERFRGVEALLQERGLDARELGIEALEALWQESKRRISRLGGAGPAFERGDLAPGAQGRSRKRP